MAAYDRQDGDVIVQWTTDPLEQAWDNESDADLFDPVEGLANASAELARLNMQVRELQEFQEHMHTRNNALREELEAMTESRDCWIRTHTVAAQNWAKELARMAGLALGRVE